MTGWKRVVPETVGRLKSRRFKTNAQTTLHQARTWFKFYQAFGPVICPCCERRTIFKRPPML